MAAGVHLIEFDVGLMLAEQRLNAPDSFTYTYEMPRELGRRATGPGVPEMQSAPVQSIFPCSNGCITRFWHASCSAEYASATLLCRYLAQHRYNLSLPELLDQVASPLVKRSVEEWTYRDVDSWPTPLDYLHMLGTGMPACHCLTITLAPTSETAYCSGSVISTALLCSDAQDYSAVERLL